MKKLDGVDYKILSELIRNAKTSDRKIAKLLEVSQPTITRRRDKLEKESLLDYTVIPNLVQLGFEILAFHFILWKTESLYRHKHRHEYEFSKEELEKVRKHMRRVNAILSEHPSIVFSSTGQGLGMSRIIISVHKRYSDFVGFKDEIERELGLFFTRFESFLVSLKSDRTLRNLTFKYLADQLIEKP